MSKEFEHRWIELVPAYGTDYLSWTSVADAYRSGAPFQIADTMRVVTRSEIVSRGYRAELRYGKNLRNRAPFYEWQHAG